MRQDAWTDPCRLNTSGPAVRSRRLRGSWSTVGEFSMFGALRFAGDATDGVEQVVVPLERENKFDEFVFLRDKAEVFADLGRKPLGAGPAGQGSRYAGGQLDLADRLE